MRRYLNAIVVLILVAAVLMGAVAVEAAPPERGTAAYDISNWPPVVLMAILWAFTASVLFRNHVIDPVLAAVEQLPEGIRPRLVNRAPMTGVVVDADTKQPIPGATVRLETIAICPQAVQPQPPSETLTDARGRFSFGATRLSAPCWGPDLWEKLRILAPGYRVVTTTMEDKRGGRFELEQ